MQPVRLSLQAPPGCRGLLQGELCTCACPDRLPAELRSPRDVSLWEGPFPHSSCPRAAPALRGEQRGSPVP